MAGFLTLGVIILLWMLVWHGLFRAWTARHPDSTWAQALQALV